MCNKKRRFFTIAFLPAYIISILQRMDEVLIQHSTIQSQAAVIVVVTAAWKRRRPCPVLQKRKIQGCCLQDGKSISYYKTNHYQKRGAEFLPEDTMQSGFINDAL